MTTGLENIALTLVASVVLSLMALRLLCSTLTFLHSGYSA